MHYKLFIFLISFLFVKESLSQDIPDWVWKTPISKVYATGEYYNLPLAQDQVNYQNPNTTTRYIYTPDEVLVLPPNVRPYPHTATQSEVEAANMTGNGQIIYASWNSYGPSFYGTGFCFSNNGGISWTGNYQMFTPNSGDPGPIIWPASSTWAGRLGLSVIQGFGYSTNNGSSWVFAMNFPGASSFDKNFSAVDDRSGSPYFGRAYTVWTNFGGSFANRIVISYSTDGGQTWSTAAPVSPPTSTGRHHQGCDVKVGLNGHVHVVWANCITNGQNSTEDSLGYARSTDGGVTWVVSRNNAADMNGIRTSNLFNGIRANGFPRLAIDLTGGPRNGWLYVVAAEKNFAPALDVADVVLMRSTDNGNTWTRIRVNQDPGNGRFQYFPAITVTPDGGVNVVYYDQRNTTGFVTETWVSRSLNGGNTWTDFAVSDHSFTPAPISGLAGGYQGDYIGITHAAGKIWPFWADNSSGIYQVWTEGVSYGPPPANDVVVGPFLSLPSSFTAGNNYTIKARVTNAGTNAQTNLPIRFSVNGVIQTTNIIPNLPPNGIDSSAFSWTPSAAGTYTLRIFSGATLDTNRNNDTVTTTVNVTPAGTVVIQQTFCRNNLNIPIPAVGTAIDSIVLNIPNSFNVTDLNIRIDTVFHTWVSDLVFNMLKGSTNVNFITNVGGSGDNFIMTKLDDSASCVIGTTGCNTAPFTGTFRPSSPLTPFNGIPINGTWRLTITDGVAGDSGLLRAWCLQICYQTLVGGIQQIEIPNYYSLAQNYPNPFNPATSIKYTIPKAGLVTLKVYDVLGREVATLVNEKKEPGIYDVNFDASHLSSGIYFYRLEAGGFKAVKKMMLVK